MTLRERAMEAAQLVKATAQAEFDRQRATNRALAERELRRVLRLPDDQEFTVTSALDGLDNPCNYMFAATIDDLDLEVRVLKYENSDQQYAAIRLPNFGHWIGDVTSLEGLGAALIKASR